MASGTDPDVEDVSHKITFESWQPEPPAGLNFLSLLPLGDQVHSFITFVKVLLHAFSL